MAKIKDQIAKQGSEKAKEQVNFGLIGHVIEYYPETFSNEKLNQNHTADVKVLLGKKEQILYRVPCFVYGDGFFSHGLKKNDRVWVEFINGDTTYPVITAYYREPTQLQLFVNSLKYGIASFFSEMGAG